MLDEADISDMTIVASLHTHGATGRHSHAGRKLMFPLCDGVVDTFGSVGSTSDIASDSAQMCSRQIVSVGTSSRCLHRADQSKRIDDTIAQ
jgi:hypothetical protein